MSYLVITNVLCLLISCSLTFVVVVTVSLEESSLSVNESEGSYMTCVTKDRDTVLPVTVEVFDRESGSAQRGLGMQGNLICKLTRSMLARNMPFPTGVFSFT